MRARAIALTLLASGVALADVGVARADLREVAARVAEQWRASGGTVSIGKPHFLNDDETIAMPVSPGEGECVSVVLVGARGISFHAKIAGSGGASDDAETDAHAVRASSVAGALSIVRCGAGPLRRIVVTSDAGRGAIEMVVGYSKSPLPSLRAVLPERTGGVIPPAPEPGDLPALPAADKRADVAELRARRDGGTVLARAHWSSGHDGAGSAAMTLGAGCHRIELFAQDARTGGAPLSRRTRLDLDAELRDEGSDRLLARDRTDAPDAHLEGCMGEETRATVVFAGAPFDGPVLVTHVTWPVPERLPSMWGNEARARMAHVMLQRHLASPRADAVFQAQGGAGTTPVPIAVEPGACYLAIVAVVQGQARGIGLRALVGARDASDDRGANDNAGAVAFCALDRDRAILEVDARGTAMGWGLAVFRVESGVWELAR